MSIMKRNPLMTAPLFDDGWTRDLLQWGLGNFSGTNSTIPAVNVRETDDNFEVEVAAPGMRKEDFQVELEDNRLSIRSERKQESEAGDDKRYNRREFSYQSFQRTLQLPKDVVDADRIEARYEHGLLLLTVPKREEMKKRPPRRIEIR
ncbi:MAG: Hsp20/alpha crystallin family protein [Chitinophagaceae bacterium]|nr:MAG: Hsp20/alpha crystallin family protein [Chitinophagaceae bacterium]